MKVAAIQLRGGADPAENAETLKRLLTAAAQRGATYIQTPEISNLVQRRRKTAAPFVVSEDADPVVQAARDLARRHAVTVHLGSVVVAERDTFRNRALLIGPDGAVRARYDKIHMFDVDLPSGERYRESHTYTPGEATVVARVGALSVGLGICFDLRFPALFTALSDAGATLLTAPSAFAKTTGEAHWHVLLRARAVENAAYMVAAAQEGTHEDGRETYGHSLIVDPWGKVLCEAHETPSLIEAQVSAETVETVRAQIPVLTARRPIPAPERVA